MIEIAENEPHNFIKGFAVQVVVLYIFEVFSQFS